MTTNLQISTADIPFNSTRIIASNTTDDISNFYNLIGGERYTRCKLATAAASCSYTFDLGAGYGSKNGTVDHFILARADLLTCEVIVASSPDNSAWTTRFSTVTVQNQTKYGPRLQDYIATTTLTSSIRYWRVTFSVSVGTSTYELSKINLGAFFNFSMDATVTPELVPAESRVWSSSSGAIETVRTGEPVYRFKCVWPNQIDSVVQSFSSKVVRYAEKCPVWLYTRAEHQILDNQRLVHARLTEYEVRRIKYNLNEITATFEEVIG